ncbi:MAG: cyanophycinase [Candidatus Limnocylindria bacterium]
MGDGHLLVIGGAEDKFRDRVILSRFIALAGGPAARIAVIATGSSYAPEVTERYRAIFDDLGAASVVPIAVQTRVEANAESPAAAVHAATGVFLTGGNQLRLASTIGGTRLSEAIDERHRHGAVVAGTSAGASALSTHMIAFGASGLTPKLRMAQVSAGLGLLAGVIIDQHFQQRNRLGRLLALVAQNPSLLGLGFDEDTAGIVTPDLVLEVIGRGSVTIVDGTAAESDAWEVTGHRPLMISNVVMHSLPAGYRFDLRRRMRIASSALRTIKGVEAASG